MSLSADGLFLDQAVFEGIREDDSAWAKKSPGLSQTQDYMYFRPQTCTDSKLDEMSRSCVYNVFGLISAR